MSGIRPRTRPGPAPDVRSIGAMSGDVATGSPGVGIGQSTESARRDRTGPIWWRGVKTAGRMADEYVKEPRRGLVTGRGSFATWSRALQGGGPTMSQADQAADSVRGVVSLPCGVKAAGGAKRTADKQVRLQLHL